MYNHIYSIVEDFVKAVEQENLKNSKELVELANSGRFIYAATRQNMNRLMTGEQWEYLRKRNIIESDWGVLKQNSFFRIPSGKIHGRAFSSLCLLHFSLHPGMQTEIFS